jgi:hypothetical protein
MSYAAAYAQDVTGTSKTMVERFTSLTNSQIVAVGVVLTLLLTGGQMIANATGLFANNTAQSLAQYQLLTDQISALKDQVKDLNVTMKGLPNADQMVNVERHLTALDRRQDETETRMRYLENSRSGEEVRIQGLTTRLDGIDAASKATLGQPQPTRH